MFWVEEGLCFSLAICTEMQNRISEDTFNFTGYKTRIVVRFKKKVKLPLYFSLALPVFALNNKQKLDNVSDKRRETYSYVCLNISLQ